MGNANPILEILKRNIRTTRRKRLTPKSKKQRNNLAINLIHTTSSPIRTILRSNIHARRKQTNKKHKPSKIIHNIKSITRNNKQDIIKHIRRSIPLNPGNNRLCNANRNAFQRFQ